LNRAAVALGKVAATLPDDLRRHARDDFGEGSDELEAIEQALAEECERAPFRLLVAIGKTGRGGFAAGRCGYRQRGDCRPAGRGRRSAERRRSRYDDA
jgi:hypothetical protein